MIKTKKVNGRLIAVGARKATKREEKEGRKMMIETAKELRKYFFND